MTSLQYEKLWQWLVLKFYSKAVDAAPGKGSTHYKGPGGLEGSGKATPRAGATADARRRGENSKRPSVKLKGVDAQLAQTILDQILELWGIQGDFQPLTCEIDSHCNEDIELISDMVCML